MSSPRRTPRSYRGAADAAPKGVRGGQYVAEIEGPEAVVFVIGMHVNRWRRVRSWWPTFTGMPKMLAELKSADAGLLGARTYWSGRTFLVLQHWRSAEELGAYARNPDFIHARAWAEFNRTAAASGDVGIFHETYVVPREGIESIYGNMPEFGLAVAHGSRSRGVPAPRNATHDRMDTTEPEYAAE